jgi:ferredoxin
VPVRVAIDHGKCCGYGVCVDVCPEVFALGDNGLGVVDQQAVTRVAVARLREAAESCPELAIDVTEST